MRFIKGRITPSDLPPCPDCGGELFLHDGEPWCCDCPLPIELTEPAPAESAPTAG
jgi:hypothetical protein